jgi:putative molybdopterin biosynthesis protein
MERERFLRQTSLAEARARFLGHPAAATPTPPEVLSTPEALGRVTAEPVFAARSVPHFHGSAMDGIAVRAEETFGASEVEPRQLNPDQFAVVDTGDPIPEGYDAVVMIEHVEFLPEGGVRLIEAARPWQHIRLAGEDLVATEMIVPGGHTLRPHDVAALLAAGVPTVRVRRKPVVGIIPTGDEIVDALSPEAEGDRLPPGRIGDSNSHLIAGLVAEAGGEPRRYPIVPDDPAQIAAALRRAADECDVVAINAGSSAGRADFVPRLIAEAGELLVHGVDLMPGKPMSLGILQGKPVVGVPGYPVSAYLVCREFLQPLIHVLLGRPIPPVETVEVTVGRRTPSKMGQEEFVRVKAGRVRDRLVAIPLSRGASLMNTVVRADGLLRIPAAVEGLEMGETARMELLRPLAEIENALLAIGSHDITLDLLGDCLQRKHPPFSLASAHVGSLGGRTARKPRAAPQARPPLLDEETGDYNRSYLHRLFPEGGIALITLCHRQQGLIVPPGNPRGIQGLRDLVEQGLVYINRQRGSGTRLLLDYELRRQGLEATAIRGYERELSTHLAVAAAVASGAADCGLGILAAAQALHLDFIPIAEERYDLAIPEEFLELPGIQALLDLITQEDFRAAVARLGGYDLRDTGRRVV